MAITTTVGRNLLTIKWSDAAADWVYTTEVPQFGPGIKVKSIQFNPSAASDKLVIRDGSLTGPIRFDVTCADVTDQRIKYFGGQWMQPYIESTEVTFGTVANVEVIIEFE